MGHTSGRKNEIQLSEYLSNACHAGLALMFALATLSIAWKVAILIV
jgi:hypothetical protein